MAESVVASAPKSVAGSGAAPAPGKRLVSLDILRGLTIAFMILVNNNGGPGSWKEMNHAAWNGFTATDLVFPTFLFVVGVSIVFSTQARLARGETAGGLAGHAAARALVLIVFGIVVNGYPNFHLAHLRFYGVLQRIAICYLIVELFYLVDRRVWTKVLALAVVLLGYWVLVRWVPVPDAVVNPEVTPYSWGYSEVWVRVPGMPGRDIPFLDKDQNIVAWVDRHLMPGHLYEDWPDHDARDPEGLLSDIPALGTALIGLLAGLWLRGPRGLKAKAGGLAAGAALCLALGYLWSLEFPLNKKMWTSSYVLWAAGWSLLLFAAIYWAVEVRGWGKEGGTRALAWPWLVFGSNAIVAYMVSELLPGSLDMIRFPADGHWTTLLGYVSTHWLARIPDPGWSAFAYAVMITALCFVPVWLMYRRRVFLKI
jgi:predicted acyltransferase